MSGNELGLGPCHVVSLQAARAKAAEYRELLFRGIDPLSQKRGATAAAKAIESRKTFRQCADLLVEAKRSEWRAGGKNEKQWLHTLGEPCKVIHDRFVDELTTNDVLAGFEADLGIGA